VRQIAADAGFAIIDLTAAYGKEDLRGLQVAEWDTHPNARAHRLIAERLYQAIWENEEVFSPESEHRRQALSAVVGMTGRERGGRERPWE
jgi:hypothetical protein